MDGLTRRVSFEFTVSYNSVVFSLLFVVSALGLSKAPQ